MHRRPRRRTRRSREAAHRAGEAVRRSLPFARGARDPKFDRRRQARRKCSIPLRRDSTMLMQPRLALVSLCTLAFAVACGDSSGPPAVTSVEVSAPASDVAVGGTLQLTATARDAKGTVLTGRPVTWTSVSQTIATVSAAGLVTGVAAGSTAITATIGGKTGSKTINVIPPPVATVSVTLAATTLRVGETTQGTAVTRDASNNVLTGRAVSWAIEQLADRHRVQRGRRHRCCAWLRDDHGDVGEQVRIGATHGLGGQPGGSPADHGRFPRHARGRSDRDDYGNQVRRDRGREHGAHRRRSGLCHRRDADVAADRRA